MLANKVVLIVLDGWGIGSDYAGNAILHAHTPTLDKLKHIYPYSQLRASGEAVGLPAKEDGNTETGHLNLGAGSIVYQDLPRINSSIANGSFFQNPAFIQAIKHTQQYNSKLHLIGLVGRGGVHSVNEHLFALMRLAKQQHLSEVYLHLITDGRDSPPNSGIDYLQHIINQIKDLGIGKIATLVGRYYAMDRDLRYERTQVAYEAIVNGIGEVSQDVLTSLRNHYTHNETDEFIKPIITSAPRIKDNDSVIFFNYRIDRPRQLTRALLLPKLANSHFQPKNQPHNLLFVTMTEYEKNLPVKIAFSPTHIKMPLSKIISLAGKRQLKLAESEKERFVTYYFNGQHEQPFPGEDIDITPSPHVPTYDLQPEMSGHIQTRKLIQAIKSNIYDFILINYANPDMVAHTGNYQATVKACQFIDQWINEVYQLSLQYPDLTLLITGDHGNAEELTDPKTQAIDTKHSSNPVPFYLINSKYQNSNLKLKSGVLGDIAPTILKLLGLQQPKSMTGHSLF